MATESKIGKRVHIREETVFFLSVEISSRKGNKLTLFGQFYDQLTKNFYFEKTYYVGLHKISSNWT